MKGLLLKELLSLKGAFGFLIFFIIIYAAIGLAGNNATMVSGVLAVVIMMLPANSISYDEFYHWDRYVLTMPLSRKMIVQSKYLLCGILVLFMMVVNFLFTALIDGDVWGALVQTTLMAEIAVILSVIALPCMMKWGAQKGRLILVLLCAMAGAAVSIFIVSLKVGDAGRDIMAQMPGEAIHGAMITEGALMGVFFLVTVAVTVISYLISCRIYLHKQF